MTSVSAAERLTRLLALVPWLAAHPDVTVPEAAAHFGIGPAELERDLWLVVCCGLPGHGPDQLIDIDFWDDGGRIRVLDPQTLTRPVRLTGDEIAALLIGLRILAQVPGDHDRAELAAVTALLEDAAAESGLVDSAPAPGSGADLEVDPGIAREVRDVLDRALREGRPVRIRYLGASRDALSERVVDPERILVREGRTYLEGWCRSAEAHRTFRLDRIVDLELPDPASIPDSAQDPDPAPIPDPAPPESQTMVLRVAPDARWILDVHRMEVHEELSGGWCRASLAVADPAWAVRFTLALGGGVVLEEPRAWRDQVRAAAERGAARHG